MSIPMKTIPGYYNTKPGIQVGSRIEGDIVFDDNGRIKLDMDGVRFAQQMGVEWIMVNARQVPRQDAATYKAINEALGEHGLKAYRIANNEMHNMPGVTLGLEDRDRLIDRYLQYITDLGEAGIHYSTYAHMGNGIWRSAIRRPVRGGAIAGGLDLQMENVGHWGGMTYEWPLSHGRVYSEDELWENYEYFIKQVVPVAESAGVYIGIHPDDPPVYTMAGVPRCIFGTTEGYKRALEIADSPNIGVCLCVGCWLEGGDAIGSTPVEFINYLLEKKKLFKLHVRNVSAPLSAPGGFNEVFPDDGFCNLIDVIKALHDGGYDGAIINDHLLDIVGGRHTCEAAFTSYLKGIVDAVQNHAFD